MRSGDQGLPGLALRLALVAGGMVLVAVLTALWSFDPAASGAAGRATVALFTLFAALVAGWVVYAAIQAHVVRPLHRLAAEASAGASVGAARAGADALAVIGEAIETAQHRAGRLADLEAKTSSLRHDIRGTLSPILLSADRLTSHNDPKVAKAGEIIVRAVNKASDRLAATRSQPTEPALQKD